MTQNSSPKWVGHRGWPEKYPENSLEGLVAACEAGAHGVELDVQLTQDGVPVVLHDVSLERTANIAKNICDVPFEQAKLMAVNEPERLKGASHQCILQSLQNVANVLTRWPDVKVFVELKSEPLEQVSIAQYLAAVQPALLTLGAQCVVISYHLDLLRAVQKLNICPVGWVLSTYDEASLKKVEHNPTDYLICNYKKLPANARPWSGVWQWFVYDVVDLELAKQLLAKGVEWIESWDVGGMINHAPQSTQPSQSMQSINVTDADVTIIGAGIQGAGIAQACAAQGWNVVVLERNASAGQETSSASSKLIHGGLRYLETFQIPLVYECLRERKLLLQNAPHLVSANRFMIPVYKSTNRAWPWIWCGLALYAVLGGLGKRNRFCRIPKSCWETLPILQKNLVAVFEYTDAQTHDTQLTQAVIKSAESLGARVFYNAPVKNITTTESGFEICAGDHKITTKHLVNAAGPWVNECAKLLPVLKTHAIDWVQGVHIVLPRPLARCYYFEAPSDGRPMFALPWQGQTLVGTTERTLNSPRAEASADEVTYLLTSFNHYFPELTTKPAEVVSVMAGVRVLPKSDALANQRSRDTVLLEQTLEGSQYVGVYGGKLTSYRHVAELVVKRLGRFLPLKNAKLTRSIRLP